MPRRPAVLALASLLYFSEGLPFGVVNELMPLYLRARGLPLTAIGFLSTISLAWTVKLLWAPAVDARGTYRAWIAGTLLCMLPAWALLATGSIGWMLWTAVAILAFASATHDIAADALTIRMTPPELLGAVNSARVATYRVALILAGGGLASIATAAGWTTAFVAGGCATLAILLVILFVPIREQTGERATATQLLADLRRWLNRDGAAPILAVVLLYRLGDSALTPMLKPMWVDAGYSAAEIGTVTTTIGISFTIAGAIAGGAFIAKAGVWRSLLWLGILQMLSNAGYALLATFGGGRPGFYAASIVENFCNGLGIAAFLSFLMLVCDRERAATEYALLSALFGLSRSIAGTVSGAGADALGYSAYFWLTLVLALPGLLLLPRIREIVAAEERARSEATRDILSPA